MPLALVSETWRMKFRAENLAPTTDYKYQLSVKALVATLPVSMFVICLREQHLQYIQDREPVGRPICLRMSGTEEVR